MDDAHQPRFPRLLYLCDFPPSGLAGGPILLARLLEEFAPHSLIVMAASRYMRHASGGLLDCRHISFPTTNAHGRWGLGRFKMLLNWLALPLVALYGTWLVLTTRVRAIISVAHGNFFLAATLTSVVTRRPLVLFVHDDWVRDQQATSWWLRLAAPLLFRMAVRTAARLYVVSPFLQREMRVLYGVDAVLQLPATLRPAFKTPSKAQTRDSSRAVIVYAGAMTAAVDDTLRIVIEALEGQQEFELHIYTRRIPELAQDPWQHPRVAIHDWVSQAEMPSVLQRANILLLPFSFKASARGTVERGFPSKTADYLASDKPVLVIGPEYSSIVQFAQQNKCAAVVTAPSIYAIAAALRRIMGDVAHCEALVARAHESFNRYHNLVEQRAEFRAAVSQLVN
jgi:glycosyltransferase involved in cell wall biosynthesis